jgi:hypothetical protein
VLVIKPTGCTYKNIDFHYYIFFPLWQNSRTRARTALPLRLVNHTQWHTTFGRTPLDEWSAHRRDLYSTTHNTQQETRHPCPRRDSNPQFQQAVGRSITHFNITVILPCNMIPRPTPHNEQKNCQAFTTACDDISDHWLTVLAIWTLYFNLECEYTLEQWQAIGCSVLLKTFMVLNTSVIFTNSNLHVRNTRGKAAGA